MPPAVTETPAAPDVLAPLNTDEQLTLDRLLARASAGKAPSARIGDPYEALTPLSVPRRGDKEKATDLVMTGEIVYLTEEEARAFERHDPGRDGRQIPVIRKLSGPDGSRAELPRILPRQVSGRMFRPPAPVPGSDLARPDPAGSSRISYIEDGAAPETAGAAAAAAEELADQLREQPQDAVDLPPRRPRR